MRNYSKIFTFIACISFSVLSLSGCNASSNAKSNDTIDTKFPELNSDIARMVTNSSVLGQFYKQNDYNPLWIEKEPKFSKIKDVLSIFDESYTHGLTPEMFNRSAIQQIADSISNEFYIWEDYVSVAVRLELMLSESVIKYSTIMQFGYLNPQTLFPDEYHIDIRQPDSLHYCEIFKQLQNDPIAHLVSAQPKDRVYLKMQEDLLKWQNLKNSSFTAITEKGKNLVYKLNEKHKTMSDLAYRLSLSGDFAPSDTLNDVLSAELLDAVNRFRKINSHPESQEVDKLVIDALNRPFDHYYRKTLANLERYRWKRVLPAAEGKNIEVNVAGAYLVADDKENPLTMKVCVGKRSTRTPLMQNNISYLNFNPYWNVPKSIAQDEICLIMKRDSAYIRKHNMRLFKDGQEVDHATIDWQSQNCKRFYYLIRQEPGDYNSLGRIKFMFPNKFSVYLHDTPSKLTFKRKNRAVSHGCVRVEHPIDLAFFCTSATDPVYQDRIRHTIDRRPVSKEGIALLKKESLKKLDDILNLRVKIPVSIDYHTTYMLPNDDTLYFADDVYGYDDIIIKNLTEI